MSTRRPVAPKSLADSEAGSIDELVALRSSLIKFLGECSPREASPIAGKIADLGKQIKDMRDNEKQLRKERLGVADEEFDPASI